MQITQPPADIRAATPASLRPALALSAAVASIALLATGCGSSSSSLTPTVPSSQSPGATAFKYSACMRTHGVPNFPDPRVSGQGGQQSIRLVAPASVVSSPQFPSARKSCRAILPVPTGPDPQQRRAREKGILAFAGCMRAHRVPSFPDPTSQGQLSVAMVTAAGVDLHAPAVQAAARTCLPSAAGAITAAEVQRAESGGQ